MRLEILPILTFVIAHLTAFSKALYESKAAAMFVDRFVDRLLYYFVFIIKNLSYYVYEEGREGGYQIPVPSLNLAQIPVPRLIFAKIPLNKSLEFSVCITALFALTYLISSTILRETFSEAIFIFPSQYLPAICKLAELVR